MQRADYCEVPVYGRAGMVADHALVDAHDLDRVAGYRWFIGSTSYARTGGGGRATLIMHRVILNLAPGDDRKVDHINGNTLDNRRANLRIVTHMENMQNRKGANRGGTSRFRGVYWHAATRSWAAAIVANHKRNNLGRYTTEIEAALAVDAWRRENIDFYRPDPELVRVLTLIEERSSMAPQNIDTTGWSREWRDRAQRATPGLSVPENTPRGRSERCFLALFDGCETRTFRSLCQQVGEPPNDTWESVERWVKDLLHDLSRVGSVTYDRSTRRWSRTEQGAAVADANAEWVRKGRAA